MDHALSASFPIGGSLVRPIAAGLRVDDREAVEACQRGERAAFDFLVERYQRDIYRLCYRYVNDPQDANAVAQELVKRLQTKGAFLSEKETKTAPRRGDPDKR